MGENFYMVKGVFLNMLGRVNVVFYLCMEEVKVMEIVSVLLVVYYKEGRGI